MVRLAKGYENNQSSYLFSIISRRIAEYRNFHPDSEVIRLDIGDVTQPLPILITNAMVCAAREQSVVSSFRGYGEEQGYIFLRETICDYYKRNTGVMLDPGEVFVSDGAKSDIANFQELFPRDNIAYVPDPVYPVYRDSNLLVGRKIVYVNGTAENDFLPTPPDLADGSLVYICSPNNPTGAAYTRCALEQWVQAAYRTRSVILFDAAYEAYVQSSDIPRSIYEIDGAELCAVEFCSLSKTAGFTGVRCGYTVVPYELKANGLSVNSAWRKRQTTKFNGVSYVVQRGAEAALSKECAPALKKNIDYYKVNAKHIMDFCRKNGLSYRGCIDSPYAFIDVGKDDVEFFEELLNQYGVTITPGSGFGFAGKNHIRITAFGSHENTVEALERIRLILNK